MSSTVFDNPRAYVCDISLMQLDCPRLSIWDTTIAEDTESDDDDSVASAAEQTTTATNGPLSITVVSNGSMPHDSRA